MVLRRFLATSASTWLRSESEGAAGCVVDEQVVAGDVEGLRDTHDDVGRGGHLAVLIAADQGGVGADAAGELDLGPLFSARSCRMRSPSGMASASWCGFNGHCATTGGLLA
jgi:hypothetical protein